MTMNLLDELLNLKEEDCIEILQSERLPLVMWGAGSSAVEVMHFLANNGIYIADIFVDDEFYSENMTIEQKKVLSYTMLKEKYDKVNVIMGNSYYEKKEMLESRECIDKVYGLFSMSYNVYEKTPISEIEENLQSFHETFELLEDNLSRENFVAFLKTRVSGNNQYIANVFLHETNFFNNDIIQLGSEEVYLDIGAFDGDTIKQFLEESGGRYRYIYAVEADEENYSKLNDFKENLGLTRIELSNRGAWNRREVCRFWKNQKQVSGIYNAAQKNVTVSDADISYIKMESLDEMFHYAENISLLKINYFQGVQEALEGCEQILQNHEPRIIITVGFDCCNVRIVPQLIKKINPRYKLYMRFCRGMASGLVLYGTTENIGRDKLLFLGDSGETDELLEAARNENIFSIVTDYYTPEYSTAKKYADTYWMISTGDIDALEERCRAEHVNAVISGASDFNIKMSILLAQRLGLPSYCDETTWNSVTDKIIFKKTAKETGVPVPLDYKVSNDLTKEELDKVVFPVMVKPVDLCANEGVSYCYTKEDLIYAYAYAKSLTMREEIIVEQMIRGKEFFAYYVLAEGEAEFLTLGLRLPQPGEPKCCYSMNTTINSFTKEYIDTMNSSVVKLLKRLGCREGIACLQCMMDYDGNFYAIEMCYSAEASILLEPLRRVCDFDGIAWQLDCAIGRRHTKEQLSQINAAAFRGFANSFILYANKEGTVAKITGFDKVNDSPHIKVKLYIHEGDSVKQYYPMGVIMFDSDDCEQTCAVLEKINETISIQNELGEDMLIYFSDWNSLRAEYQEMSAKRKTE